MIAALDLLVVGGLSIDRFPDGTTRAGGSVLHAARAAAAGGWRVATIALAGSEPEADAALAELAGFGPSLVHRSASSIRYAIDEEGPRRSLILEATGGLLPVDRAEVSRLGSAAVLVAPIARELDATSLAAVGDVPIRVASIQGWLRRLTPGLEVAGLPLSAVDDEIARQLAGFDALVASSDDLSEAAASPESGLDALRERFGVHPTLVVTDGWHGSQLDLPGGKRVIVPAPRRVQTGHTVGAGDAFAGVLAVHLGRGATPVAAANLAAAAVADLLARSG